MSNSVNPNMQTPDWLTKEFLEKLLENDQDVPGSTVVITKYNTISDIPKGNNYMSDIIKIGIDYKIIYPVDSGKPESSQKVSLIAKIPLKKGPFVALNSKGVFEKELGVYNELLPNLNAVLLDNEDYDAVSPKFFKNDLENIMIMEDLGAKGYKTCERINQLDYDHGVVVMRKLAKFHAASIKLHEIKPEVVERYGSDEILKREMDPEVKKLVDSVLGEEQLELLIQEFEKWPETKKFVDFLKKLKPKIWEIFCETIHPYDGEFVVLNHGDLWTNNMLFSYDKSGKPNDVIFIDYQIMKYTTPTYDLLNFLYTSIRYDSLTPNFYNLTQIYFDNINVYLEKYGSTKRLEENDFRMSLEKREIFALLRCLNILPFMFAEHNEDESNDEVSNKFPTLKFIQNKKYRTVCTKYLEDFSKKTWFKNFE